jgi:hypothetical protein
MQRPGVTSSRRGSTSREESRFIAIALLPQHNDQGRRVLNGFTQRSYAVNDQVWVANLFVVCANEKS